MRVCIIGFDALEYEVAKAYPDLAQAECRKMSNDIGIENPGTPQLWAVILTGEMPEVNGITGNWYSRKRLKVDTWFDRVPGSVAIQVPCYNITWFPQGRMTQAMGKPAAMRAFAEECWKQLDERRKLLLEAMDKEPPLLMIHIWCTDFIQHMYAWSEERMKRLYEWCAETARLAGEKMGEDGAVLVMSDHGMLIRKGRGRVVIPGHPECRRGYHTPHSFFSSSVPIGFPENPHIKDIFPVVLDLVEMPSTKDTEKVVEHLRKLGYME